MFFKLLFLDILILIIKNIILIKKYFLKTHRYRTHFTKHDSGTSKHSFQIGLPANKEREEATQ